MIYLPVGLCRISRAGRTVGGVTCVCLMMQTGKKTGHQYDAPADSAAAALGPNGQLGTFRSGQLLQG